MWSKIYPHLITAIISGLIVWYLDPTWDLRARQEGWIPAYECPNSKLSVSLTAPGNGSKIRIWGFGEIRSRILVESTRPLGEREIIGLAGRYNDSGNIFVSFPQMTVSKDRRVVELSRYSSFNLPGIYPDKDIHKRTELWVFVANDKNKFGDTYANLEQLSSVSSIISISSSITLNHNE